MMYWARNAAGVMPPGMVCSYMYTLKSFLRVAAITQCVTFTWSWCESSIQCVKTECGLRSRMILSMQPTVARL